MSPWRDSDLSSDECNQGLHPWARKRSSRACDQCRKTKSKCENQILGQCKSCVMAGTSCTFLGPNYKRGPPKGYIHAIEQRWQQVESLLGVIISCPDSRTQSIVSELRKDDLACEIIKRVDSGPFGSSGRLNRGDSTSKEDLFAAIFRSGEVSTVRDSARSRRQSRISREKVSSTQDTSLAVVPTGEWQDGLSNRLAASCPCSPSKHPNLGPTLDHAGSPLLRRRRLDLPHPEASSPSPPNWNEMYTMEVVSENNEGEVTAETADGIGQLSLDENQQVHFHGKASGLHLLAKTDRTDSYHEDGIWRLPTSYIRAHTPIQSVNQTNEEGEDLELPPLSVQDHLVDLYFTYVHPNFPVIRKTSFMTEYEARTYGLRGLDVDPTSLLAPGISKLLLFSMFAIAARYVDTESSKSESKPWEDDSEYLDRARQILAKVFHHSRPRICQALLLLGYRELGIGSMEQSWIYIGTAIRMALDLGLNRNSDKWQLHGEELFSVEEKRARQQIWWSCCIADKYISVFMGRPVAIRDEDFDANLPELNEDEENRPQPSRRADEAATLKLKSPLSACGRTLICFHASASLSVIVGLIVMKVYPVRSSAHTRRPVISNLENQLHRWYINLPEGLRFSTSGNLVVPPPHILLLHISYWGAVLLLQRASIPNQNGNQTASSFSGRDSDAFSHAVDLCQNAASHISTIVNIYLDHFGLNRCSPHLPSYILDAGIIHAVALTLRSSNIEASLGLRQSLSALKAIEAVWPSASQAWELLNGVKVRVDNLRPPLGPDSGRRHKRHAEAAFDDDGMPASECAIFGRDGQSSGDRLRNERVQQFGTQVVNQILGLDNSSMKPLGSYISGASSGAEWWLDGTASPRSSLVLDGTYSSPNIPFGAQPLPDDWTPCVQPGYAFDPVVTSRYGI